MLEESRLKEKILPNFEQPLAEPDSSPNEFLKKIREIRSGKMEDTSVR